MNTNTYDKFVSKDVEPWTILADTNLAATIAATGMLEDDDCAAYVAFRVRETAIQLTAERIWREWDGSDDRIARSDGEMEIADWLQNGDLLGLPLTLESLVAEWTEYCNSD